jgi:replicative DNA helicase
MVMNLAYGKIPPHHLDVEKAVLGALMLEKDAVLQIIDVITPDTFYNPDHQKIFEYAILPLFRNNKAIDILTVTEKLQQQNYINDRLSPYFITQLTNRVASSANIVEHALILKQAAIKRNLITLCSQTLQKAFRNDTDSLNLLDNAARQFDSIGLQVSSKPFTKMDQIIKENIQEIQEAGNNEREITGVASGFYDLDKLTAGWQKTDLIIIAARPGMGKSTLALNMAESAAIEFDKKVAFFSLEMSKLQLGKKSISSQSEIALQQLRIGKLDAKDWKTLHQKIAYLVEANIFIDDQPAISVFEMKTKLRRLKHEHPDLGMVVVDYLQLMNGADPDNKSQNREQQISYISRSLKGIAK